MDRRSFLKGAAFAGVAATVLPSSLSAAARKRPGLPAAGEEPSAELHYRPDGSFKLLQFTDTHYIAGDPRSERALRCVEEALDAEKPDLIIHTGDILFGRPDIPSALEILRPVADRGIPFAVALGNHDAQFGSSREKVFRAIRDLPGCLNTAPKEGVYGQSNDVITLSASRPERVFYLFDSMDAVILRGEEEIHSYDYIRYSQLGWYRAHAEALARRCGGKPVPALAFFHIPLCEVNEALASPDAELVGINGEPPCPSRVNSGLLAQFREMGDVEAVVTGHDHDCDYVLRHGPMFYIYGRFSGCDTVYNHLGRRGVAAEGEEKVSGCRLFSFQRGEKGFRTWVRLYGGEIQQPLYLKDGRMIKESLQ